MRFGSTTRTIPHKVMVSRQRTRGSWGLAYLSGLRAVGSALRIIRGSYVHKFMFHLRSWFNRRQRASMLLEHPTGPYNVGATTFALQVRPADVIGKAALRTETGQITPALRLEEVSFTAYYPASLSPVMEKSRQPSWLDWFPRYVLYHGRYRCQ